MLLKVLNDNGARMNPKILPINQPKIARQINGDGIDFVQLARLSSAVDVQS